jgi:molybdenum-dependent DNA-binding transcriptional regulator ModE
MQDMQQKRCCGWSLCGFETTAAASMFLHHGAEVGLQDMQRLLQAVASTGSVSTATARPVTISSKQGWVF